MILSKTRLFFILFGFVTVLLILSYLPWLFSSTEVGFIVPPPETGQIHVIYKVHGVIYENYVMRNEIPLEARLVVVRFLKFHPSTIRINSLIGMFGETILWWAFMITALVIIFLTNDTLIPKDTCFRIKKAFPWIETLR